MARQESTSKTRKKTPKKAAARTRKKTTKTGKTARKTAKKAVAGTRKQAARTRRKVTKTRKAAKKTAARVRKKTARAKKTVGKTARKAVARAGKKTTRTAKKVVKARKKLSKAAKARIDKLRTMLEQRRAEILASIRKAREDSVEAHMRTFSEVGDLVSASLEKEMAFKYGEYGVNMLREIDTALEKLKGGNYGICETCGKIIGVKRLEVVPSARLCIKCKSREEEGGTGSP